jgi:hypothetical protein
MPIEGLENLKDIIEPEAISGWPPAIGWWLLAVLIPLLIGFMYWLYKFLTRKTAIKTAKKALAAIKQDTGKDNLKKLGEISILIRRIAISLAPGSEAAGLTGNAWLNYLDGSVKGKPFSEGVGRYLVDAPYRREAPAGLDIAQLIGLCEDWLKAQAKK